MTFLTTLMTRLYGRLAQAKARGESGQGLVEYGVFLGGLALVGMTIYLVVGH